MKAEPAKQGRVAVRPARSRSVTVRDRAYGSLTVTATRTRHLETAPGPRRPRSESDTHALSFSLGWQRRRPVQCGLNRARDRIGNVGAYRDGVLTVQGVLTLIGWGTDILRAGALTTGRPGY